MESSEATARVLIVANRTAATPALIQAVRERAERGAAAFTLLVPSSAHGLHQLVDPEDQGRSEAEATLELALPLLEEAAGRRSSRWSEWPSRSPRSRTRSTCTASTR